MVLFKKGFSIFVGVLLLFNSIQVFAQGESTDDTKINKEQISGEKQEEDEIAAFIAGITEETLEDGSAAKGLVELFLKDEDDFVKLVQVDHFVMGIISAFVQNEDKETIAETQEQIVMLRRVGKFMNQIRDELYELYNQKAFVQREDLEPAAFLYIELIDMVGALHYQMSAVLEGLIEQDQEKQEVHGAMVVGCIGNIIQIYDAIAEGYQAMELPADFTIPSLN